MKNLTNEERKWCVYVHINKINGKRYVGITCQNPNKRWNNGEGYKTQQTIYRAIQKYGWDNFEHIVICTNKTKREANNIEKYLIKVWNTKTPFGYNLTEGGDGGLGLNIPRIGNRKSVLQFDLDGNLIKEWQYLSDIKNGVNRISKCCNGKYVTANGYIWLYKKDYENNPQLLKDKLKYKLIKSNGRVFYSKKYYSILQYDLNGNFIKEWNSVKEVADNFNKTNACVYNVLKRNNNRWHNYIWKHRISKSDTIENTIEVVDFSLNKKYKTKQVICLSDNKIFNSITNCAKHYNLSQPLISYACKSNTHKADGKIFMYLDEYENLKEAI